MENKEEVLYRVIADLTRKNEDLEYKNEELMMELVKIKAMLKAYRSRVEEEIV